MRPADIGSTVAWAEADQDIIADDAGPRPEFIDADLLAENLGKIAGARSAIGKIAHVGDTEVHRYAPDKRAAATGDDDLRASALIRRAGGPRKTVGVSGKQGRKTGRTLGDPLAIVADAHPRLDRADLLDPRLQLYDPFHRIGRRRRRIAAVKRITGTREIVVRALAQEYAGRIGEACRNAREERARFLEALDLQLVQGIVGLLGSDEVTHHQADARIGFRAPGERRFRLGRRGKTEPAHSSVEVNCKRRRAPSADDRRPAHKLVAGTDHRRKPMVEVVGGVGARLQAVENENGRTGAERGAGAHALLDLRYKERPAARVVKRPCGRFDPDPIGVSFDYARAFCRLYSPSEKSPIVGERGKIDGQHTRRDIGGRAHVEWRGHGPAACGNRSPQYRSGICSSRARLL